MKMLIVIPMSLQHGYGSVENHSFAETGRCPAATSMLGAGGKGHIIMVIERRQPDKSDARPDQNTNRIGEQKDFRPFTHGNSPPLLK
nr:hypothetical protein [Rhizobium leguminosarum]